MALGMSTQGSINSLLSSIPSTSVNATQTESTQTDEAANDSQGLPSMFAALLSQLPTSSDEEGTSTSDDAEPSLSTGLLSALSSDDAISTMQNSLLSALQNNVFSGLTSAALATSNESDSSSTTDSTVEETALDENTSSAGAIFDNLYTSAFGEDGLSLNDGFDTLNIVNHLPIVSDIYEATTSSHIDAAASLAGSFLYGGMAGMLYNVADLTVEGMTGKSISSNLWDVGKQVFGSSSTEAEISGVVAETELASTGNDAYQFVKRNIGG
tara:strand:+ start:1185 stop:1991 length:807 start_codon:yes stop_codon:yes gene_type:complete